MISLIITKIAKWNRIFLFNSIHSIFIQMLIGLLLDILYIIIYNSLSSFLKLNKILDQ